MIAVKKHSNHDLLNTECSEAYFLKEAIRLQSRRLHSFNILLPAEKLDGGITSKERRHKLSIMRARIRKNI